MHNPVSNLLTIWLLAVVLTLAGCHKCPDGFDPNCVFCDTSGSCLYCATGFYLNQTSTSSSYCFPCMQGCERCDNPERCTLCQLDEFYMEDYFCLKCSIGCKVCSSSKVCDTCFDKYLKIADKCLIMRVQVYIVGFCLVILSVLLIACCTVAIKKRAADSSFYVSSARTLKSERTLNTFNSVLDEDSKRDRTRVNEVNTIGQLGRSGISFIENKTGERTIMEDDSRVLSNKQKEFMQSFR